MGLDMYLDKEIYIGANYDFNGIGGEINLTRKGNKIPVNFNKVRSIVEEGIYWRKANQIHKWFVDNVQDGNDNCGRYYVDKETLRSLLETINTLFEKVSRYIDLSNIDFDKADETEFNTQLYTHKDVIEEICGNLLPSQSGFFFGGIAYDFFYFYDLDYTKRKLEELLESAGDDYDIHFYYHSSW